MLHLKTVDRIAIAAMLMTALSIPLAVHAAPNVRNVASHAVLQDDTFLSIVPGMSVDEVVALIGQPTRKERFERLGATAWDYAYRDAWGYEAVFSVMIGNDGRVVSKVSVRKDAG